MMKTIELSHPRMGR
jgi:hypothetical protein